MKRSDRGYTLMELLVAIGAASVVLGVSVMVLNTLFRLDSLTAGDVQQISAGSSWLGRLRADIGAAQSVRIALERVGRGEEDPTVVMLTLRMPDGNEVQYQGQEEGWLREVHAAGQVQARELYRVGSRASGALRFRTGEGGMSWLEGNWAWPAGTARPIPFLLHFPSGVKVEVEPARRDGEGGP